MRQRGTAASRLSEAAQGVARSRLRHLENVELLIGDWAELLPPRGPFGLVLHDAGNFKRDPETYGSLVLSLLEPGGLLVLDDLTPGRAGPDAIRDWVFGRPQLAATEVLTTPAAAAPVIARL